MVVGFIPDNLFVPCKRCKKNLETVDSGYPASRYLGTTTFLCNCCVFENAYMEKKYSDGAEIWNFPPHCPSWRRDREKFIYFAGCKNPKCEHGRSYVSRAGSAGGSYYIQCEVCSWKFYNQPSRKISEHIYRNIASTSSKVLHRQVRSINKLKISDEEKIRKIEDFQKVLKERRDKLLFLLLDIKKHNEPNVVYLS